MGLRYKMDMVEALRSKGWNTGRLRRENEEARERGEKAPGISEASLQALRQGRPVSWANLEILCKKLQCQPGDFLEYVEDEPEEGGV